MTCLINVEQSNNSHLRKVGHIFRPHKWLAVTHEWSLLGSRLTVLVAELETVSYQRYQTTQHRE